MIDQILWHSRLLAASRYNTGVKTLKKAGPRRPQGDVPVDSDLDPDAGVPEVSDRHPIYDRLILDEYLLLV